MRIMTDVAVDGRSVLTPAPVFRASEEFAAACRLVRGQECSGSAAAAWQVESVSGAGLAGAARVLGLVVLGEGLLERHGYVGLLGQERPRPVFQPAPAPLTGRVQGDGQPRTGGEGTFDSGIYSDNDSSKSSKSANGTKPMTPWDFRTCSPPG